MVFLKFWGSPAHSGTLCNLREVIRRTHVDKCVKVFSVGDEFLVHAFKGHLISSILIHFRAKSPDDPIEHRTTECWLQETADQLVLKTLMPSNSTDPVYKTHRSFLHQAYLYIDLREAIRWDNGQHNSQALEVLATTLSCRRVYKLCNRSHSSYL